MPNERFLSHYRIRHGAEFRRAYQLRRSAADGRIVVYGYPNGLSYPRLGISASRRIGGAVVRNRWKRLLREAFRLTRSQLPDGIDLIVVPRPDARPRLSFLTESLPRLATQVHKKLSRNSVPSPSERGLGEGE